MVKRQAHDVIQLKLRFRESLRAEIEKAADASGRSLNAEIVARLEASIAGDHELGGSVQADLIRQISMIMNVASAGVKAPWWRQHASWKLVRHSVVYLLEVLKPQKPPELVDRLSAAGLAKVEEWRKFTGMTRREWTRVTSEIGDLELKDEVLGLETEERERLEELRDQRRIKNDVPELSRDDMMAFLQDEQRHGWHESIWAALRPILQTAANRLSDSR